MYVSNWILTKCKTKRIKNKTEEHSEADYQIVCALRIK